MSQIHVEDVHPFVLKVLDMAMKKEPEGSVYSRVYIIGANENNWKDISTKFAREFHAKGIISSPEPRSVKWEDVGVGEIANLMGANLAFKSDRATRLGYKPTHPNLFDSLHEVVDYFF
jgi:hypothetical protein